MRPEVVVVMPCGHDAPRALREASEGGGGSKATLDNLKNENSTLVQQNMLLQAQHDQVARELSSAKAKLSSKN